MGNNEHAAVRGQTPELSTRLPLPSLSFAGATALALCALGLFSACVAPRLPLARPAPLPARQARAALGHLDGVNRLADLAAFITVSETLGNRDEAAAARQRWTARLHVERALAQVGLARGPVSDLPAPPPSEGETSLETQLWVAAVDGDHAIAGRLADELVAADRHHWPALLIRLAGEELNADLLTPVPGLLADLVQAGAARVGRRPLQIAARLLEASAARPEAACLPLALAYLAFTADAFADARQLATEVRQRPGLHPAAVALAESMAAVAALALGELDPFTAWATRAAAKDSPFVASLVIELERQDAPREVRVLAANWRRTAARRGDAAPWWVKLRNAADPALPLMLRQRGLGATTPELELVVHACADAALEQAQCLAQLETAVGLDEMHMEEVAPGFTALIDYEDFPERWLAALSHLGATTARRLMPLERLADTRLGATTAFAQATILAHLAGDEADAAAAALTQMARNVPPAWRLAARVAIDERRTNKRIFAEALADWWAPPDVWMAEPRATTGEPASSLASALRGWTRAVEDGELAAAMALVVPWLAELPADEVALLNAPAIRLAWEAQDHPALAERCGVETRAASPAAPWACGLAHQLAGNWRAAALELAEAWRATPTDDRVLFHLLTVLAGLDPGPSQGVALAALLDEAAAVSYLAARLRETLTEDEPPSAAELAAWAAATRDGALAWELGARGAHLAAIRESAVAWREQQLAAASPAIARTLAAETAGYLDGVDLDDNLRLTRAWLLFVAGAGGRARDLVLGPGLPLHSWSPLVLLSYGREGPHPIVDDELALALWRAHRLGREQPEDVALRLAALAPDVAPLHHYLCRIFVDADLTDLAFAPCARALDDGPVDEDLAAATSWLALQHPVEAARFGFDPAVLFEAPPGRLVAPDHPAWLTNRAFWLLGRERRREAALLQRRAWTAGGDSSAADLDVKTRAAYSRYLGPLNRLLPPPDPYPSDGAALAQAALSALQSGEAMVARDYATAAARWSTPPAELELAATVLDLVRLAERDRSAGRLDAESLCDVAQALAVGSDAPALDELRSRAPAAHLVHLLAADRLLADGDGRAARALLEPLVGVHPDVLLVQLSGIAAREAGGDPVGARSLWQQARATHPNDSRLERVALRAPQRAHLPAWARDATNFAAHLAATPPATELARHASVEQAAELFLPTDWRASERLPFGFEHNGAWVSVTASPRVSRCTGAECLAEVIPELEESGFTVAWTATESLPAGEVASAWLNGPGQVIWLATLPAGGRVFTLSAGGPVSAIAGGLVALAALRQSFRPLDLVLGAGRAERLRDATAVAIPADLRYEARRLLSAPTAAPQCALAPIWSRAAAALRPALLLDVYLTAGSSAAQLGLLACVADHEPAAAALGLPALLADDLGVHHRGRAIAVAWPEAVIAAARAALLAADDAPLSARPLEQPEWLPSRGLLEVLAALPAPARAAFAGELLRSGNTAHHALALAAGALIDDLLPVPLRDSEILTAPPALAALALLGLANEPPTSTLAAIRARCDQLTALTDPPLLALANRLAWQLAPRLESVDGVRLKRMAGLARALSAEELPRRARADADDLDFLARAHARGLAQRGRSAADIDEELDPTLAEWLARGANPPASRPPSVAELERPLAELLPGDRWTFVRLARPDLFATSARTLFARLAGVTEVDTVVARRSLEEIARQNGGSILAAGSGLALDAPIECAAAERADRGFVCSARLIDANRVLELLGGRQAGADAAVALPLNLGTAGAALPAALSLLPALLHDALYHPPGEPAPGRLLTERVRHTISLGGLSLSQWTVVEIDEELGATVDSEYYLIAGDRLLAFSSRELAEELLLHRRPAAAPLAASRRFRKLTVDWRGGNTLEAALLPHASPLAATDASLRLALGADQITVNLTYAEPQPRTSVRTLCDRLPNDPVSRVCFAAGQVSDSGSAAFDLAPPLEPLGPVPPTALLAPDRPFAFGWYPQPGEPLWSRWIAVLDWDDGLRARWADEGLPAPSVTPQQRAAIWFALDQGHLLLASSAALLAEVHAPRAAAPEPAPQVLAAHLASEAAAHFLHELARSLRAGDPRSELAQTWATLVGASREIALTGSWTSDTRQTEMSATLALRQSEGQHLLLIEQWLAGPLRNALRLPRRISEAELRRPLRLVFAVPDAEVFAERSLPPSPRRRVTTTPGRVEVIVQPALDLESPVPAAPLDAATIQRLLAAEPRFPVRSAEVQNLARRVAPALTNAAAIARAVVAWVHRELTYEVTPHQPDVIHVIETRRGDCTEFSELTVTLLRALGVPAELRHGLLLRGGEAVMHAWVAFHDGRTWREIEPTEGWAAVGSGHLEISVFDFASLISMQRLRLVGMSPAE